MAIPPQASLGVGRIPEHSKRQESDSHASRDTQRITDPGAWTNPPARYFPGVRAT